MNEGQLVGIVALLGSLILDSSSLRARRVNAGSMVVMALAWGAIFALAAAVFSMVTG